MEPWTRDLAGRFDEHVFASDALRGNALDDPHERPLWVYVPPGYGADADRRYPAVYMIQGLTGQLDMWRNRSAFRDALVENGIAGDVIRFELFDATHMAIDYRYPMSLAWMCRQMAG